MILKRIRIFRFSEKIHSDREVSSNFFFRFEKSWIQLPSLVISLAWPNFYLSCARKTFVCACLGEWCCMPRQIRRWQYIEQGCRRLSLRQSSCLLKNNKQSSIHLLCLCDKRIRTLCVSMSEKSIERRSSSYFPPKLMKLNVDKKTS